MMEKNNEALMQYVEEIKNLRNLILNDIGQQDSGAASMGSGGGMVSAVGGVAHN